MLKVLLISLLFGYGNALSVAGTCEISFSPAMASIYADTPFTGSQSIMNMTINPSCSVGAGCNCYTGTYPITCVLVNTFPASAAMAYTISNPNNIAANGGSPTYCSLNYATMISYSSAGAYGQNTVQINTIELAGSSTLTSTWFYQIRVMQATTTSTTRLPTTSSSTSTTTRTSTSTTTRTSTSTTTFYLGAGGTTALPFASTPAGIAVIVISSLAGAAILAVIIYFATKAPAASRITTN